MKKILLPPAALLLSALFIANASFPQLYAYHKAVPQNAVMTLMTEAPDVDKAENTVSIDANLKLQKAFNKQFKNAEGVKWYALNKDYIAEFVNEGRQSRAFYTKNGLFIYALAYGAESNLPKEFRRLLKGMYLDYEILNTIEIQSSLVKYTTWLVMLKDDKNVVIGRFLDGGYDEFAHYKTTPREQKKQRKGRILLPKS